MTGMGRSGHGAPSSRFAAYFAGYFGGYFGGYSFHSCTGFPSAARSM